MEDICKKLVRDSTSPSSTACDTEHLKLKSFNIDEECAESSSNNVNSSELFSSESISNSSTKNKEKIKTSKNCNYESNQKNRKSLPTTPSRRRSDEDCASHRTTPSNNDQNMVKIDNMYKLINKNHNAANLMAPNQLPPMPLKDAQDFLNMESYLENPDNYIYFINRLSVIGGTNVRNSTMNILKFVLTDDLASHYNWAGRKSTGSTTAEPKHSFKSTLLMPAISDSIKMAYSNLFPPDLNDQHIEKAVKDWLKLAPQRFSNKSNKKS